MDKISRISEKAILVHRFNQQQASWAGEFVGRFSWTGPFGRATPAPATGQNRPGAVRWRTATSSSETQEFLS